jgi:sodium/proline symporter
MAISTPMLVTFIVYIFGMVLIGFIAWRSTKTLMIIFSAAAVWAICDRALRRRLGYERLAADGIAGRIFSPVFPKAGLPLA